MSNEKKQIEEMTDIILIARRQSVYSEEIAEAIYNAGYRKQSEGEWKSHKDFNPFLRTDVIVGYICSCCENESDETTKFCPNCGAKMKGGAEL